MKTAIYYISACAIAAGLLIVLPLSESQAQLGGHSDGVVEPASSNLSPQDITAESFHDCLRQGCSSDDCAAATQNGFTCKSWKCFKGCLSSKGFSGSCYDYAGNPQRFEACKRANDACEGKCK